MGIKIFLRKTSSQNCFRKLVTELPNIVDLNKLILCSGFFQEDIGGYLASTENNFCNMLNNNNVEVTTYGVYNNTWLNRYKNFITGLVSAGVKVKAMYKSGTKWHAKILIYKYDDHPVIDIIGRSNITRT